MRPGLLTSVLQVRSAEQWSCLLLAAVLFTIQLVDGIIDVVSVSAFVGNVGVEQVPYLALTQGMVLLVFSNLYALFVDRWPKPRLLPALLLIYGLLLCVTRGLIAWGQIAFAIYAALYVLRWQMFFLLGIVFWAIVSDTFVLASASRLVPVIGAAGFLGTVLGNKLGGESGHVLVRYSLQADDVLLITTALLGIGAWALWWLNRRGKWLPGAGQRSRRSMTHQSLRETLREAPHFIRDVRILRLVAIIVFISSTSFFLILFEFLSLSRATYVNNLDFQMFYGNVQAGLQVLIFLLQLVVSNRLFARWGAATGPLGLPLVLILGGSLFWLVPGLWIGVLVMYASDVSFMVFERPSIDVLFTLVPPEMKGRVKTVLDTFVRSAGYVVGAGLLLVTLHLVKGGWLEDRQVGSVLGSVLLAFGLVSLAAVVVLVRNYATYLQDWRLARRPRNIPESLG